MRVLWIMSLWERKHQNVSCRYQIIYTSPNLLLKTEGPVLARQSLVFNSPIYTAESVQKSS